MPSQIPWGLIRDDGSPKILGGIPGFLTKVRADGMVLNNPGDANNTFNL